MTPHHPIILAAPGPLTLVTLAPLTNIALLLRMYPEVAPNIGKVITMGGSSGMGNATPVAEFNVWHDPEAAAIKHLVSPVAGQANVLVAPDLEAGNMLAKSLTFMAGASAAGIVLGARVPVILTSRADTVQARLASCAVAVLVAHSKLSGVRILGS